MPKKLHKPLYFSSLFEIETFHCDSQAMLTAHTAKNAQVATSLLTTCNNLLQQADIRMCSHGLRQLVDDKSVVSCHQGCIFFYNPPPPKGGKGIKGS